MEDDEVFAELTQVKQQLKEAYEAARGHARALCACEDAASLPRLNAAAQDTLSLLRALLRRFDLLAQQLLSEEEKEACLQIQDDWKTEYQSLHTSLRNANLQAKSNIQKAAQKERDLLLGGGEEATKLRHNLRTQTGMSAAAESITESLRRTRQMMVQELDRGANTLATLDESNTTLRKADSEYKGQRSLLTTTRGLLSMMKQQDVLDRIILVVGFLFFCLVVSYVFNQRIGIFKLQRNTAATQVIYRAQVSPPVSVDLPTKPQVLQHVPKGGGGDGGALNYDLIDSQGNTDHAVAAAAEQEIHLEL